MSGRPRPRSIRAEAELEHFHVTAIVDGIVSRLDVCPGVVARPGTTVWGEIVDLRELDVRCELRPEQADHVAVGQKVEVRTTDGGALPAGSITFIGPVADATDGARAGARPVPESRGTRPLRRECLGAIHGRPGGVRR